MNRIFFILIIISFTFCKEKQEEVEGYVLAEVGDKKLYKHDLDHLKDVMDQSTQNAFIEKWARDQVLVLEARTKIESSEEIDKLTNSYRDNLYKLEYESSVINNRLPAKIENADLLAAYNRDKLIYALKSPVLKINYISIDKNQSQINEIRTLWKANNWGRLNQVCKKQGINASFDKDNWVDMIDLSNLLPKELLRSRRLRKNLKFEATIGNTEYYIKILDFRDKNEEPPLEYISDQLSNVILHRKKRQILNELTEELYQEALKKNKVKIY